MAVYISHPMFIEHTITRIPPGFYGYKWLDTKIVFKQQAISNFRVNRIIPGYQVYRALEHSRGGEVLEEDAAPNRHGVARDRSAFSDIQTFCVMCLTLRNPDEGFAAEVLFPEQEPGASFHIFLGAKFICYFSMLPDYYKTGKKTALHSSNSTIFMIPFFLSFFFFFFLFFPFFFLSFFLFHWKGGRRPPASFKWRPAGAPVYNFWILWDGMNLTENKHQVSQQLATTSRRLVRLETQIFIHSGQN